jgi:hypothetical protein
VAVVTDEDLRRAEVEALLLDIQRKNESMGQVVARVANAQRQELRPILQDIIERQDKALTVLLKACSDWRDGT